MFVNESSMFNRVKLKWPSHGMKVAFRGQEVASA